MFTDGLKSDVHLSDEIDMRPGPIVAVALLALTAGCSTPAAPAEPVDPAVQLETDFLASVRDYDKATVSVDDDTLLKGGYLVCRALTSGEIDEDGLFVYTITNLRGSWNVAVGMKADELCPDWFKG